MLITAKQKYVRQSSRKVRLVANKVRKLSLEDAIKQLSVIERRSTLVILKVVKQAIANATNNFGLAFDDLKLKDIVINDGPIYKRMRPVSRGRGHRIEKRTSHITVILEKKQNEVTSGEATA
jgi:large subunit ribosomal protein L22